MNGSQVAQAIGCAPGIRTQSFSPPERDDRRYPAEAAVDSMEISWTVILNYPAYRILRPGSLDEMATSTPYPLPNTRRRGSLRAVPSSWSTY